MKKIIFLMVLFLLSLATLSCAYEYVLEKGKGCEVCEAYEKNLNSLKPNSPIYRRTNPELKDFSTPKWESQWTSHWIARAPTGIYLPRKISDFFWKRDVNPAKYFRGDLSNWQGTKKQLSDTYKRYIQFRHKMSSGTIPNNHLVAEVDIDNDGVVEPVYLDNMYSTPTLMLVLKPDYSDIDYEKTKLITMHPSRKKAGWKDVRELSSEEKRYLKFMTKTHTSDAIQALYYGVFIYKNNTYFDFWGLGSADNYGTIYL
ncbi:MAG: hypothetical protein ABIK92_17855, partial [Pseudomonadota bacterium]